MAELQTRAPEEALGFIIGARNFAAITSVEGLKLSPEIERTLKQTESLPSEERRKAILHVLGHRSVNG